MSDAASKPSATRSAALGWVRRGFVVVFAGALLWAAQPTPALWAAGFAIAALGEALRVWAAGILVKSKQLITAGPYQHVRNPLYVGRLLILTGVCIACVLPGHANLVVLVLALAVFLGYYIPRKERVEPERLERLHGEPYARYRAAVPSLLPRLRPYGSPHGTWTWGHFVENEEASTLVGLLAFFAVLAWRAGVLG